MATKKVIIFKVNKCIARSNEISILQIEQQSLVLGFFDTMIQASCEWDTV